MPTAPRQSVEAKTSVLHSGGNLTPVPDPTELTVHLIIRELSSLKEVIDTRLDGIDRAQVLLQTNADKAPSVGAIEERIKALTGLTDERFVKVGLLIEEIVKSLRLQILERDTRTEKASFDQATAISAAFSAAKESAQKSETNTTKNIDNIILLFNATVKGNDDKFADLKDRMTALEARKQGGAENWGAFLGLAGLLVAATAVVISIVIAFQHK
jgi:hypothetical protein